MGGCCRRVGDSISFPRLDGPAGRPTYNGNVARTASGATPLDSIKGLHLHARVPLSEYTRFGIGGPADLLAETNEPESFCAALCLLREQAIPHVVLGGGTNLVVADEGFPGVVLRYTADYIRHHGRQVHCAAGAELMELVNYTVDAGLEGLQTLMGIPGWVGAAIYGNAGAYGHAIEEVVRRVRYCDGQQIHQISREECGFQYRESIFKRRKEWIILDAELELEEGDRAALRKTADEILEVRNQKFPPTMRCAGSIFKNLYLKDLPAAVATQVPPSVVREGKIPAAWFLEQVGAKDRWEGRIHVAPYHANLVYNTGGGTAAELCRMIQSLKREVQIRFGIQMEEEVQYVGFPAN
ncbi:MAG: UDP-N-acetylmuramate dehydrogenase [Bryobacterales bacterium]|nr:UDP-N-acetylmuramate dehydrogenase [Bryobacterales bacterium]